ncbi:MAG: hypothetical protein LBK61_10705 [Spirochaetaceae bacterium]|nr:hypothetical protein [Spirochaetaceae bacterium]
MRDNIEDKRNLRAIEKAGTKGARIMLVVVNVIGGNQCNVWTSFIIHYLRDPAASCCPVVLNGA